MTNPNKEKCPCGNVLNSSPFGVCSAECASKYIDGRTQKAVIGPLTKDFEMKVSGNSGSQLEGWEERFDQLFTMEWDQHASWQDFGNAVSPEQVKSFISQELERARKEERERIERAFAEHSKYIEDFTPDEYNEGTINTSYYAIYEGNIDKVFPATPQSPESKTEGV